MLRQKKPSLLYSLVGVFLLQGLVYLYRAYAEGASLRR
jgi:hypothetical protein